ncbi:hypothetical protein P692DRAFT_20883901 [Suillus brevipes Sb2]|nr:hypothetical protein P692DRAFT_20883901 [Suillus brevipes Sb2]
MPWKSRQCHYAGKMYWLASNSKESLPVEYLNDDDLAPVPSETQETQSAPDNTCPSSGLSAAQPSKGGSNSQAAGSSSGLTAAQLPKGGSDSKRKAEDALESATKKPKVKPDEPDLNRLCGSMMMVMAGSNPTRPITTLLPHLATQHPHQPTPPPRSPWPPSFSLPSNGSTPFNVSFGYSSHVAL